jgi:hypothetical protein
LFSDYDFITHYAWWREDWIIFRRYPKTSAIGFARIPSTDEGGLSLAAVNRMIAGAIRGVKAREQQRQ